MKNFLALLICFISVSSVFAGEPTLTHFGAGKPRLQTVGVLRPLPEFESAQKAIEIALQDEAKPLADAEIVRTRTQGDGAKKDILSKWLKKLSFPKLKEIFPNDLKAFWCFRVIGDGDCGFYALETTRDEIIEKLLIDLENKETLRLIRPEMLNFFATHDFDYCMRVRDDDDLLQEATKRFLKERYVKPKNTANGETYYLEALPDANETGVIDWIARYKKVNVNLWQWRYGQATKIGVKFIKTIAVQNAERTIDLVQGRGHFSRLVNSDETLPDFEFNVAQAIAHEKEWQKISEVQKKQSSEDEAVAHAIALSLQSGGSSSSSTEENDDDYTISFPGKGQRLGDAGGAVAAHRLSGADRAAIKEVLAENDGQAAPENDIAKYFKGNDQFKKWDNAQTLTTDDIKALRLPVGDGHFAAKGSSDLCIARIALPQKSSDAIYSIGVNAAFGGRFTYLLLRDAQQHAMPFALEAEKIDTGTHLYKDVSDTQMRSITLTVPARTQAYLFFVSPWSGGRGNIVESPEVMQVS